MSPATLQAVPPPLTRQPTGEVGPPLILLEGEAKSGRSWKAAELTGSPLVGPAFWLEIGQTSADEYVKIPGADYLMLEHDGTFHRIHDRIRETHDYAAYVSATGGKPVVLVIDVMGAEWALLSAWVDERNARTDNNKRLLAANPDAELTKAGRNLWNDANSRHNSIMRLLMTFPGIVVMIADGKEISATGPNGQPVAGQKSYRVEGQKDLDHDCTIHVRMKQGGGAQLIALRSVTAGVRSDLEAAQKLPPGWSLADVVFNRAGYRPDLVGGRTLVQPTQDRTPEDIRAELLDPATSYDRTKELYTEIRQAGYGHLQMGSEQARSEPLAAMAERIGKLRRPVQPAPAAQLPATVPAAAAEAAPAAADPPAAVPAAAAAPDPAPQDPAPPAGSDPQIYANWDRLTSRPGLSPAAADQLAKGIEAAVAAGTLTEADAAGLAGRLPGRAAA